MKTQRTIDCFIEDMIEQLKGSIKGEIAGDEEKFGLDGDLEKKFGLFSKTYKTKNSN